MVEKTDQTIAADNQAQSTDDLLTKAAMKAVQGATTDDSVATTKEQVAATSEGDTKQAQPEQPEQEYDKDGLPLDHGARSELGRKIAAYHRRLDEFERKIGKLDQFDAKLEQLLTVLDKSNVAEPQNQEPDIDPDEPLTYRDFIKLQERMERQRIQQQEAYNNKYISKIAELTSDQDEAYVAEIMKEMEQMRYTPTDDPERDAELNFLRAERAMLRKKMAKPAKKPPVKGESPGGTITGQKVPKTEQPLPKLDAAAMSYLAYIRRTEGEEAALKYHKELAKEMTT